MTAPECHHILHREGLSPPHTLTIAITGACNLQCSHCWVEAGVPASATHAPTAAVLRIIEEFAALGGKGIRITGGEPLTHPHWLDFLSRAKTLQFPLIDLQTNGMLFTERSAAALRDLGATGLSLQVSLDGASPGSHDLVRGAGAFAGTLSGLRHLARAGLAPRISLFFTEMRHNLEELPALLELAESLGVAAVRSGTLIRGGRAAPGSPLAPPEPEQYLRLAARFDTDQRFREHYERLGTVAALEWLKGCHPRTEQCTFVANPYLTPSGRLYPCVLCHTDPFSVTDVFSSPLSSAFVRGAPLWGELRRISDRRCRDLASCQQCIGKESCAGGCMGRAWGSSSNLLAPDDRCAVRAALLQKKATSVINSRR